MYRISSNNSRGRLFEIFRLSIRRFWGKRGKMEAKKSRLKSFVLLSH